MVINGTKEDLGVILKLIITHLRAEKDLVLMIGEIMLITN